MKNTFGNSVAVTIFGESHGAYIGAVLDGLAPGIVVDEDVIRHKLSLRRPQDELSTPRQEQDDFRIVSGVFNGVTTGTPLCVLIPNSDTHSKDYTQTRSVARPGHADYTAYCKYHGYEDYRGGGHFSGRITAAIVAAGAIVQHALEQRGIYIGTHISQCYNVIDRDFSDIRADIDTLNSVAFPVLDPAAAEAMKEVIRTAREQKDSVGGVLQTAVVGMPNGVGEPWFDSIESQLSHALFSVPAIKGVEFGDGFDLAAMLGSEANDGFTVDEQGAVTTVSNHNGGINGGISNGMPILFRCAVKPTPSIAQAQNTIDFMTSENTVLEIKGRHDPAIIHRARVVVDSVTALVLADVLAQRYGTDWLKG